MFADVADDMTISKEEIFGPVQIILKYDNLEDVRPFCYSGSLSAH